MCWQQEKHFIKEERGKRGKEEKGEKHLYKYHNNSGIIDGRIKTEKYTCGTIQ